MKDQTASKDKVSSIFGAWWFKFAVFGGATAVLAFWGTPLWTGFAAGLGVMSMWNYFSKK